MNASEFLDGAMLGAYVAAAEAMAEGQCDGVPGL
jgi:hypothetical protein